MRWLGRAIARWLYDEDSGELRRTRAVGTAIGGIGAILIIVGTLTGNKLLLLIGIFSIAAFGAVVRQRKRYVTRKVKIEAARGRTSWPWRAGRYLLPDERIEWEGREHYILHIGWWLLLFGSFAIALTLGVATHRWIVFLILWIVPSLVATWKILGWYLEWIMVTDKRIVKVVGIIRWRGPAIPLQDILFVEARDSPIARLFGFRGYHFDTASQEDPYNDIVGIVDYPGATQEQTVYVLLNRHFKSVNTTDND